MIKAGRIKRKVRYITKVLSSLKRGDRLLDIGCGTAHIIEELSAYSKGSVFVGLDVSPAMLKIAKNNMRKPSVVHLVEADGLKLPFGDEVFDVVIIRLAEYSPKEAYRVLRKKGCFFEYGLGPDANKEIREFFPDRFNRESFFIPKNRGRWKKEACQHLERVGFAIVGVEEHKDVEHYQSEGELMDLIEMVPLVNDFDRTEDRETIGKLAEKYRTRHVVKVIGTITLQKRESSDSEPILLMVLCGAWL